MFPSGPVVRRLLRGAESPQERGAPYGSGLGAALARVAFGPGGAPRAAAGEAQRIPSQNLLFPAV